MPRSPAPTVVGLAVVLDGELLAIGVAPAWRRQGLATALLGSLADAGVAELSVQWTVAERDVIEPLDVADRRAIARRLVERAGAAARGVTATPAGRPPASDLVDVRLLDAIDLGGCAICAVRARSERATLDGIIAERVLDLGFRAGLERDHAFCRRHVAELIEADRRASGILGSSILYGAMLERRLAALRDAVGRRGRSRRSRLEAARRRPPCLVCSQGATAVETALGRLAERAADPAWAAVIGGIPFCLDDLGALVAAAGDGPAFEPILEAQLARLDDLHRRLEGYAHNSAQDRRHLVTDGERAAAQEAAKLLGGDR